jgi:hypothetical protein
MMGVATRVLRFHRCDNIGRIIMIGGVSSSTPSYSPQQLQAAAPKAAGLDSDGDHDNDATESASVKATESGGAPSLPTDPNRGRNLNISA